VFEIVRLDPYFCYLFTINRGFEFEQDDVNDRHLGDDCFERKFVNGLVGVEKPAS